MSTITKRTKRKPKDSPDTIARRLEVLTGNELFIGHAPNTYADNDVNGESKGHLYRACFYEPSDRDYHDHKDMWLDDRKEEPLAEQLISELRRVAAMYSGLADELEQKESPKHRVYLLEEQCPPAVVFTGDQQGAEVWVMAWHAGDLNMIPVVVKDGDTVPSFAVAQSLLDLTRVGGAK